MEAEEHELVIDYSVNDLMTYSDKELTDAQIEKTFVFKRYCV